MTSLVVRQGINSLSNSATRLKPTENPKKLNFLLLIPILYEDALNEPHPKPLSVYGLGSMIKRNFTENWYQSTSVDFRY
ncbi:hypothetical protein [Floridanema aerugineum]|uniref:Uncharacterized protein n=1 Tax=Floridaenema aerugineum BLCC-F46 TaxID=3153654 RepID=A0ABV4X622_9CYAN